MIRDLPFDFFDRATVAQGLRRLRFNDRGHVGVLRKTRPDRTACAKPRIRRLQARAGRSVRHEIDATDHGAKACVSNAKLMGSRKGVGRFTADPFCKKRDLRWSTALPIPWLTRSPGPLSRRVPAGISPPQTAALGPTPGSASRNPGNQLVNCHAQNPRHLSIAALLSDHCLQSLALSAVMRDFGLHPGFFRDPISPRRALRSDAT
jgi:hypothetical protein